MERVGAGALGLLGEVLADVAHHLTQALWGEKGLLGVDAGNLAVVDVVGHLDSVDVVDAEGQDVLVPDGVDNCVGVQLVAEGLGGGAQVQLPG